jgi:hypothetical protein
VDSRYDVEVDEYPLTLERDKKNIRNQMELCGECAMEILQLDFVALRD